MAGRWMFKLAALCRVFKGEPLSYILMQLILKNIHSSSYIHNINNKGFEWQCCAKEIQQTRVDGLETPPTYVSTKCKISTSTAYVVFFFLFKVLSKRYAFDVKRTKKSAFFS